jgi:hypothetical protein
VGFGGGEDGCGGEVCGGHSDGVIKIFILGIAQIRVISLDALS